jgi:hypothetical protein
MAQVVQSAHSKSSNPSTTPPKKIWLLSMVLTSSSILAPFYLEAEGWHWGRGGIPPSPARSSPFYPPVLDFSPDGSPKLLSLKELRPQFGSWFWILLMSGHHSLVRGCGQRGHSSSVSCFDPVQISLLQALGRQTVGPTLSEKPLFGRLSRWLTLSLCSQHL